MPYIEIRQIKFATILQVTRFDENDFVKSYNFFSEEHNYAFFLMEYIDGKNLFEIIKERSMIK